MAIDWDRVERYADKKEASQSKAFELMGLISAGSFATILSINEGTIEGFSRIALIAAVINVCSVVTRFLMSAKLWGKTASVYIGEPQTVETITVPGSSFVFNTGLISFVVTCASFIIVLA
ncbi:MAG TPA: hypothetical protein PL103_07140 [Saccharofermentans sp.]|nr:hypothetical protein [Saccharofermentans sp.]